MADTAAQDRGSDLRQDEAFLRRAFHRALLPCVLSILSENINILVDGILVGQRIGTDGLSAISLCVPVYLVLCVAGSFLVSGTAIQAAKAIGRQQQERSQRLYHTAVWACLAVSGLMTAAGLALGGPLSALLCADPAIRPLVREYTTITLLGALPKILIYIPFWFLRIDGRTKLVARMMLVMGGGNAALDLLFLYPLDMGIGGAAWASVIATAAACAMGFCWLCGRDSSFHLGVVRAHRPGGLAGDRRDREPVRVEQSAPDPAHADGECPADGSGGQRAGGSLYCGQLYQRLFPGSGGRGAAGRLGHAGHLQR